GNEKEAEVDIGKVCEISRWSCGDGRLARPVGQNPGFPRRTTALRSLMSILGGAATYFALAASYFTEVRMVAVVGDDFTPEHEAVLTKRGVDTRGIERVEGKTFRWGGQYLDNLNEAKTDFTELNVFEKFQPRIPKEYSDTQFLFLANI